MSDNMDMPDEDWDYESEYIEDCAEKKLLSNLVRQQILLDLMPYLLNGEQVCERFAIRMNRQIDTETKNEILRQLARLHRSIFDL